MVDKNLELSLEIGNPCTHKKGFCNNCHSHFRMVRPMIKNVLIHKHFIRDLKRDQKKINSIVKSVLDCSHLEFHELHKFEKNIDGKMIFRAKREGIHYLYSIDKKNAETIIFLRAMKNYSQYKRLLSEKKQLRKLASSLFLLFG
jgi:mRNA-degrading endonuclease RelE of RelBE toxin-antitoxin system